MTANDLRYLLESVFVTLLFRLVYYGSPDNINIFLCFLGPPNQVQKVQKLLGSADSQDLVTAHRIECLSTRFWRIPIVSEEKNPTLSKKYGHILQNIQFR